MGSFVVAVPLWLQLLTSLAVTCSLVSHLRRACFWSGKALRQLIIGQQVCRLCYPGYSLQASLPQPVYISSWLLVLQLYAQSDAAESLGGSYLGQRRRNIRIVLFADSLSREQRRRLCIFLRFGVFL